jgi:NADH-quinone oxidoreductase subunit N
VIHAPHVDWFALSPALAPLGAAGIALLGAVLVPARARRLFGAWVAGLGFAGGLVASIWVYVESRGGERVIADTFYRDRWMALAAAIVCAVGVLAVLVSYGARLRDEHVCEYFALLAAAGAGMVFFVGAANLMTLFLSLEWFSLCLYVMCAIDYDLEGSLEAGLKYLIVGSFGSAALLFGSALTYGATGKLGFAEIGAYNGSHDVLLLVGLAMVLTGLGFKASAAPFHMWTPDVYVGSPTPVTAFMAAATKTVALVVAFRVLTVAFRPEAELWTWAIAGIAVASLVIGNLAALTQRDLKRMLAYSSISHAGFMLIAVSAGSALGGRALMYYLVPYVATAFGSFAVVAVRERELGAPVTLDSLAGFGWERPFLGIAMWFFMLGQAGFPLTGGFLGKFYVFSAAYRHGWIWLVIVGVVATLVSVAYYLAVVRAMYMRPSEERQLAPRPVVAGGSPPRELAVQAAVAVCLVVTVGSFFAVQPLITLAKHAAAALPL